MPNLVFEIADNTKDILIMPQHAVAFMTGDMRP